MPAISAEDLGLGRWLARRQSCRHDFRRTVFIYIDADASSHAGQGASASPPRLDSYAVHAPTHAAASLMPQISLLPRKLPAYISKLQQSGACLLT